LLHLLTAAFGRADIKLRPLFGRYGVESGHHRFVMSISAFDPEPTCAAGNFCSAN
jgi:hypothetical protein